MTLLVPFDGTALSEAALVRAAEFGTAFEAPVLAVAVVPAENAEYARERGWLDEDEPFRLESVLAHLRGRVTALAPDAEFRHEVVDRFAARGTIARRIRAVAEEVDAAMVFVGSENAGRLVTSITSVGSSVAADGGYDVVVVRQRSPSGVASVGERSRSEEVPSALDTD